MISYGNQLAGKDDNDNTLIIRSLTSLTIPSADITGDFNFGTILESKVCVSAANTSNDQSYAIVLRDFDSKLFEEDNGGGVR